MYSKRISYFLVTAIALSLLTGCPDQKTIAQLRQESLLTFIKLAQVYTTVCFNEESSRNDVAVTMDALNEKASDEHDIVTGIFSEYREDVVSFMNKLDELQEKYSAEKILRCAQENFDHVNQYEQSWFDLLNDSQNVIRTNDFSQGIAPLSDVLAESDIVLVGNNHMRGLEHSFTLESVTAVLESRDRSVKGLFVEYEDSENNGDNMLMPYVRSLQRELSYFPIDSEAEYADRAKREAILFTKRDPLTQNRVFRENTYAGYMYYGLRFPNKKMIPLDIRHRDPLYSSGFISPEDFERVMDHTMIQSRINSTPDNQTWLMYYGETHTLRFPGRDSLFISQYLTKGEQPLKTFVISQFLGDEISSIERQAEAGLISEAWEAATHFFAVSVSQESFGGYLQAISTAVHKYQRHFMNETRLFVNFSDMHESYSDIIGYNEPLADLLIIQPSFRQSGEPFEFDNFSPYSYLSEYLTHLHTQLEEFERRVEKEFE